MARLRRVGEPICMAWSGFHGYYRPSAEDPPEEIEDATKPAEDGGIAHILRDWIEGGGIDPDSNCYKAGCSEADNDHAAGSSDCTNCRGYNGWKISAEEMEIMTFVQCIALKPDDWVAEDSDEDFELNSDFMLTALSTAAPSDHNLRHVPYRHGVGGDSLLVSEDDGMYPFLLPFHAPCFRIYERQYKLGDHVDGLLEDLWDLRDTNGNTDRFLFNSRGFDLDANQDQLYRHIPDTEYLAADPVNIPALPSIISSCICMDDNAPLACLGVVRIAGGGLSSSGKRSAFDLFSRLPPELRLMILEHLDYSFQDVLNLRLVSRAFWRVPQVVFQYLVERTMPWFWEMSDLESVMHKVDWCELWHRLSVGSGGSGTNVIQMALSKDDSASREYPKYVATDSYECQHPREGFKCELVTRTSFKSSRHMEGRMLGLMNRRRIWGDIEGIIDEIEHRKYG